MQKIPVEVAIHVERQVPEIVDEVQRKDSGTVVMRFDAFAEQPSLLYNCVWYATSNGKRVVIEGLA